MASPPSIPQAKEKSINPKEAIQPEGDIGDSTVPITTTASPNSTLPVSSMSVTHDTSRIGWHMSDLQALSKNIEIAVSSSFPNHGGSRYQTVNVGMMMWEHDTVGVEDEFNRLSDIFEKQYQFNVEHLLIPATEKSQSSMMYKALGFIEEFDATENLFILYYAGHGRINDLRQSTWVHSQIPGSPTVDWSHVQGLFERGKSDVLILLDCCAAASAAASLDPKQGNARVETIAACGFEAIAPPPGSDSFSASLIEVLEDWINVPAFSVAMLYSEVFRIVMQNRKKKCSNGIRMEWRRTPVHITNCRHPRETPIELCRRRLENNGSASSYSRSTESIEVLLRDCITSTPVSYLELMNFKCDGLEQRIKEEIARRKSPDRDSPHVDSVNTDSSQWRRLKVPHMLVLLEIDQEESLPSSEACRRWIASFPGLAKHVTVDGVYRGHSTVLILSVPVVIWNTMPDHPACRSMTFVTSKNLIETSQDSVVVDERHPIQSQEKTGMFAPSRTVITDDQQSQISHKETMGTSDTDYRQANLLSPEPKSSFQPREENTTEPRGTKHRPHTKRSQTTKSRGREAQFPSEWSSWEWTDHHKCNVRYRLRGPNDYEYEYEETPSHPSLPRDSSITFHSIPETTQYSPPVNYATAPIETIGQGLENLSFNPIAQKQVNPTQAYRNHVTTRDPDTREEKFDPNYRVHHASDFKWGKIFKVLWTEPRGNSTNYSSDDGETSVRRGKHGQMHYEKVRRFLIVHPMDGHCLCLPINTYTNQGTLKPGVHAKDHTIIWTERIVMFQGEDQKGMNKTPIRVEPYSSRHKLGPASRLNYAKVYTVDYNVKVWFIGKVHRHSEHHLVADYNAVNPQRQAPMQTREVSQVTTHSSTPNTYPASTTSYFPGYQQQMPGYAPHYGSNSSAYANVPPANYAVATQPYGAEPLHSSNTRETAQVQQYYDDDIDLYGANEPDTRKKRSGSGHRR